jgi:hypothetical protein
MPEKKAENKIQITMAQTGDICYSDFLLFLRYLLKKNMHNAINTIRKSG